MIDPTPGYIAGGTVVESPLEEIAKKIPAKSSVVTSAPTVVSAAPSIVSAAPA
jgi:hypothetical protein